MDYREIPPGRYLGTVTSSCLGRAGNGTEQLAIGFDVHLGMERQSLPMTWYGFFTDRALETTEKALRALGWDPADHDYQLDALNPQDPMDTPLAGAEASLVLEQEDDGEGGCRVRIRWVNSVGGGLAVKERMEAREASAFSQNLRARLIAQRGPQQRRAAPATQPRQAVPAARPAPQPAGGGHQGGHDFDDIPFLWIVGLLSVASTAAAVATAAGVA